MDVWRNHWDLTRLRIGKHSFFLVVHPTHVRSIGRIEGLVRGGGLEHRGQGGPLTGAARAVRQAASTVALAVRVTAPAVVVLTTPWASTFATLSSLDVQV